MSVYVYWNSAAYCDSKFGNTAAIVEGDFTSSDPGTVKSSDCGSDGYVICEGYGLTMLVHVVLE